MSNKNPTINSFDTMSDAGMVRQSQLIQSVLPFSAATLWRRVKNKTFPAPVKISPRCTAWRVVEVRAWLANQGGA